MVNATRIQNSGNLYDLLQNANSELNGFVGVTLLVLVGFALYFALARRYPGRQAFIASQFITSIIAAFLWQVQLIPTSLSLIPLVLLILAVLAQINQGR